MLAEIFVQILMWTLGILVWANIILWGSLIALNILGFLARLGR